MSTTDARAELLRRRLAGLTGIEPGDRRTIPARAAGDAAQLSFAQERVWFMEQLVPGTTAYHVSTVIPLVVEVSAEQIGRALLAVVDRHVALRCVFPPDDDGRPTVVVRDDPAVPVSCVEDQVEPTSDDTPFDLVHGPLVRARVHTAAAVGGPCVVVEAHHLVLDGWSTDLLVRELVAELRGEPRPTPAEIDYLDFAAWQRARDSVDDLGFWRSHLEDVPALHLPTDRPRPARQSFAGSTEHRTMRTAGDEAERLAGAYNCSVFVVLLTVYQVVLARVADQTRFAVGTPVAGRTHPELEPVVGMFVNMLAAVADLDDDPHFEDLLERNRAHVLEMLDHQELPFEQLVQDLDVPRDPGRSPIFQATLALQNFRRDAGDPAHAGGDADEVGGAWRPLELSSTRFDLEWRAAQTGQGLWCEITYNRELFDSSTIRSLFDMVEEALHAVAVDPAVRTSAIQLGHGLSGVRGPELVVDQSLMSKLVDLRRHGDGVAVSFEDRHLTWAELDEQADAVAGGLRARGCRRGDVVALDGERSLLLLPTVLGILRAGCAFLPLDPDLPPARRARMIDIAGAEVVLDPSDQQALVSNGSPGSVQVEVVAADAAYVLFTSGSTGEPKGVVNTHGGLANRIAWMQERYDLRADEVVLQKTPTSFDVSVWELLWPVSVGAGVVLAAVGGHRDPEHLEQLCEQQRVSVLHFVPSMLAAFQAAGARLPRSVRQVVCSGEALPPDLVRTAMATHPWLQVDNLYGPTEAAIDVTLHDCRESVGPDVPLGRAVPNTTLHVLDSAMRPVPAGVAGRLFISGVQVARGYLSRPGLTACRFVPDPFGEPGSVMYDTGDRARVDADGLIHYLGRGDDQVKLRGQRIEPAEIAAVLRTADAVLDAVAVVREDTPGDRRLAAYVVGTATPEQLRDHAARHLAEYMIPATFTTVDALPTTVNGKLDVAALPRPVAHAAADERPPDTPSERTMAALWSEVLGHEVTSATADFFDEGGHSLLAATLVARIRRERDEATSDTVAATWSPISVMDVFSSRRLDHLAERAAGAGDGGGHLLHELTPRGRRPDTRLVCIPYGGGSAAVYQPLADEVPDTVSVHALAIPGHDVGTDEEPLEFDEIVGRVVDEVLDLGSEPLRLYGHCGVGTAMITAVALGLEARGRELEVVYTGAMFPIARVSRGRGLLERLNRLESNRSHQNWLKSMGVDMDGLSAEHADRIVGNMRTDTSAAQTWFTDHYDDPAMVLRAPIVSIVGDQDPVTDFYEERFREWTAFAGEARLCVLPGAGHFFLKHRAQELAQIVTGPVERFRVAHDQAHTDTPPSMSRFAAIAIPQTITLIGSAMTAWALPIYLYLEQGSLGALATLAITGLVPMLLVTPLAGSVSDRFNRRVVMLVAGTVSASIQVVLLALVLSDALRPWMLYVLVVFLGSASAFQRVAYMAAVPQVVPKRFLAHAMGLVQLSASVSTLLVPVFAAGLMAAIGLQAIVSVNIATWVLALAVLSVVRFPDLAGRVSREPWLSAVLAGFAYVRAHPGMRRMIGLSAVVNIFIAPALLLIVPLVLSIGTELDMGRVSLMEGIGAVLGGMLMLVWGGPPVRRMRAALVITALLGLFVAVIGLRPSLILVSLGAFGFAACIELLQATYATIIQTKVPQRLHGRLLSLNIMLSWSTLPIGYLIGVWAAGSLREPMTPGGALADGPVGSLLGVGPGRGIGLTFVSAGLCVVVVAALAMSRRAFWDFDTEVPDDVPDDLLGVQSQARQDGIPEPSEPALVASAARRGSRS